MVSVSAATPVPGSSRSRRDAGADTASSSAVRSATEKEFASPVVPSMRDAVAALVQQIAAMRDEARMIGRELGVERRQRGAEHAMRVQR